MGVPAKTAPQLATNAPTHWPRLACQLDPSNEAGSLLAVASHLAAAPASKVAVQALNRRVLTAAGIFEVPLRVSDGGKVVSVFPYATADAASAAHFAGVQEVLRRFGQPSAVYYAPKALPAAPAAQVIKPLDTYHFTKAERAPAKGQYGMWWTTPEDPDARRSPDLATLQRIFTAFDGYESWAFGVLLQGAGLLETDTPRVALPVGEPRSVALEAPDGHVVLLSASAEKGLRFHFHSATPAKYRTLLLGHLASLAESMRKTIEANRLPRDPKSKSSPLGWFTMARHQLSNSKASPAMLGAITV